MMRKGAEVSKNWNIETVIDLGDRNLVTNKMGWGCGQRAVR